MFVGVSWNSKKFLLTENPFFDWMNLKVGVHNYLIYFPNCILESNPFFFWEAFIHTSIINTIRVTEQKSFWNYLVYFKGLCILDELLKKISCPIPPRQTLNLIRQKFSMFFVCNVHTKNIALGFTFPKSEQ